MRLTGVNITASGCRKIGLKNLARTQVLMAIQHPPYLRQSSPSRSKSLRTENHRCATESMKKLLRITGFTLLCVATILSCFDLIPLAAIIVYTIAIPCIMFGGLVEWRLG